MATASPNPANPNVAKPPKFKVGDEVVYVNDFGGNYGKKKISEVVSNTARGTTYKITPDDSPSFPISERFLFHPNSPVIKERTKFIGTNAN